jgi:hypothetical protein
VINWILPKLKTFLSVEHCQRMAKQHREEIVLANQILENGFVS